eukprot:2853847-Amphidinium_carterae.1
MGRPSASRSTKALAHLRPQAIPFGGRMELMCAAPPVVVRHTSFQNTLTEQLQGGPCRSPQRRMQRSSLQAGVKRRMKEALC